MYIHKIQLNNFRNHQKYIQDFDKNLTLVIGTNGIGKTNLLEAIYLVATAKSPRTRYDSDLISLNKSFTTIQANVTSGGDNIDLELQVIRNEGNPNVSSKRVKVNKTIKSVAYFTGMFNAVLFTPQDIDIITGSPNNRRKYLDLILIQSNSVYKKALSSYTKALRQRNKLLEEIRKEHRGQDQIAFWDNILTQSGTLIQEYRHNLIDFLNERLDKIITELNPTNHGVKVNYKCNKISAERLEKHFDTDLSAQTTLIGPHRDDFSIEFNNSDIGQFGSRGQQRTIILALKLLEIDYFEEKNGQRPVLLLDDIFSELDNNHKSAVLDVIDKQQTLITSAEELTELEPKLGHQDPQIITLN